MASRIRNKIPPLQISRKCFFSAGVGGDRGGQNSWGHNYTLEAHVSGPIDPVSGLVINLTDLDVALKETIALVDHKHLSFDVEGLEMKDDDINNLGHFLMAQLKKALNKRSLPMGVQLKGITLKQDQGPWIEIRR